MSHELLETEAAGFFDDLCEAFVAALSHEAIELIGEPFGDADRNVAFLGHVTHQYGTIASGHYLTFTVPVPSRFP